MAEDVRGFVLRPVERSDEPFLARLFADVRGPELAASGLSGPALTMLLQQQRHLQRTSWRARFPTLEREIVEVASESVGWIVTAVEPDVELRLVDLALLADHRGRGLGSALLARMQARARQESLPLVLQVVSTNPARRLYDRVGFVVVGDEPPYLEMVWHPSTPDT